MFQLIKKGISIRNKNFLKCCGAQDLNDSNVFWLSHFTGTADGKKKDVSCDTLSAKYDPQEVESGWYEWWEKQNYFKPTKSENESFTILLPPPNITGSLHLGHVLTTTIQDVIVRWKRMKGESVIWVPGIDHAGIAAQASVEKYLMKTKGLRRQDMDKSEFLSKMWEWKHSKEKTIISQLRSIGASLDWTRLKFTMDTVHCNIVAKAFIQLYNEGLIYRKRSPINWSCALKSSISDIEIDWVDVNSKMKIDVPGYDKPVEFGMMYKIAYKICDEDDEIVVATTRPETILGDVAIAVHPDDRNYARYRNKMAWHPFRREKIPVILDEFVDPTLGTGAVKITPSHSLEDYKVAQRHNLTEIDVIDEEGVVKTVGVNEKFHGLKRYNARDAIIDELKTMSLFRGAYEHPMKLPLCSRSGDVVEQLLKSQWFLNCKTLTADAMKMVETRVLKLNPDNYGAVWSEWLNNTSEWNLSRQLWWGHQIPMYECTDDERTIWVPAMNLEEATAKACGRLERPAHEIKVTQDPDVVDTWFSSGLLPLNTMPSSGNIGLSKVPISLMVTGHDILFFWVARMVMLTKHLTGRLPFNDVYLHGLVCDSRGMKMSKSLGNVIEPEDIIKGRSLSQMKANLKANFDAKMVANKEFQKALDTQQKMFPQGIPACGVDALRFTLSSNCMEGAFVAFDMNMCLANRHFCNKIWQAVKYYIKITNDWKATGDESWCDYESGTSLTNEDLNFFDRWILSRLAAAVDVTNSAIESNRFAVATKAIKTFVTSEFCDFYLESSKSFLSKDPANYRKIVLIFHHCLDTSLKLLAPFMPFISEHLYQALPSLQGVEKSESITVAKFPSPKNWERHADVDLEKQFKDIADLMSVLRRVSSTYRLGKNPNVFLKCSSDIAEVVFSDMTPAFARLSRVGDITKVDRHNGHDVIEEIINDDCVAFVEHDLDKETLRKNLSDTLKKEDKLKMALQKLIVKFANEDSGKQTPVEMVHYKKQISSLKNELAKIEKFKRTIENCSR